MLRFIGEVPSFLTYMVLMVDDPGSNVPHVKEESGTVQALFSYTLTFIALMLPVFGMVWVVWSKARATAVTKMTMATMVAPKIPLFCIAILDAAVSQIVSRNKSFCLLGLHKYR